MLPHYLREPLEQLVAKVTPLENGTTHVQVPGADRHFTFTPHSDREIHIAGVNPNGTGMKDMEGYAPTRQHSRFDVDEIMHHLSEGTLSHQGPHHTLSLEQFYRSRPEPHLVRHGRFSHDLESNPLADYTIETVTGNHDEDPIEAGLVHGAFEQRPNHLLYPLLDYLAEKHNHGLPLLHSEPHQYARQLSDRYEELQEQLL
jgi:hypothetical protein